MERYQRMIDVMAEILLGLLAALLIFALLALMAVRLILAADH